MSLLLLIIAFSLGTGSWLVQIGVPAGPIQLVCALVIVACLFKVRANERASK